MKIEIGREKSRPIFIVLLELHRDEDDQADDSNHCDQKNRATFNAILVVNVRETQDRVDQIPHWILLLLQEFVRISFRDIELILNKPGIAHKFVR